MALPRRGPEQVDRKAEGARGPRRCRRGRGGACMISTPERAPRRAVVLLSGGLDSATTLAIAKDEGFEVFALSFRYGQRHAAELDAARRVAERIGVAQHLIAPID